MTREVSVKITADSAAFQAALNQAVQSLNSMTSQMTSSLNTLRSAFSTLNTSANQSSTVIRNLNSNIGGASSSAMNRLSAQISALTSAMGTMGGQINALNGNVNTLNGNVNNLNGNIGNLNGQLNNLPQGASRATSAITALVAGLGIKKFVEDSREAIVTAESSFRGLESIANSTGVGVGEAMKVAGRLSADGLVSTADASKALQSLLARGYSLDQAEQTLIRLKDAAAFNRQANLSMSEAVRTAAEGLKAENSILVDNAGVTKNVAKMWIEYAQARGISTEQMTRGMKIEAEYLGIQKETEAQMGNAAIAAKGLQGEKAQLSVAYKNLTEVLGQALIPIFSALGAIVVDMMKKFTMLIKIIQSLGAVFAYAIDVSGAFFNMLKSGDMSKFRQELKASKMALDDYLNSLYGVAGAKIDSLGKKGVAKPVDLNDGARNNALKEEEAKSKQVLVIAEIEKNKKVDLYNSDLKNLKSQLDKKLITYSEYASKAIALENSIVNAQKGFLETKLEQVTNFFTKATDVEKKTNLETEKFKVQSEIDKLETSRKDIPLKIKQQRIGGGGGGRSTAYRDDNSQYKVARAELEASYELFKANADAEKNLIEYKYKTHTINAENYYADLNRLEQADFEKRQSLITQEIAENKKKRPQNKQEENAQKVELIKLESDLKVIQKERAEAEIQNERALKDVNDERIKRKQLNSLDLDKNKSDAGVQLEKMKADELFATRRIDSDKLLALEKASEEKMLQSTLEYYEKKKKLYAGDLDALIDIQQDIENATLNSNLKLAQLDSQRRINSEKNYTDMFDSMQSGLERFFNSASKEPKKLGDAIKALLEDVASEMRKQFSQSFAKQIMGKDGMGGLINGLIGGGSSGGGGGLFGGLFSSGGSSGGGGGGGGFLSGIGSFFSNLLSFDVGTNYVPQDMIAKIHKGERIVPAKYNNEQSLGGKGMTVSNTFVISGPANRSTQSQIANSAASAVMSANRRKNA